MRSSEHPARVLRCAARCYLRCATCMLGARAFSAATTSLRSSRVAALSSLDAAATGGAIRLRAEYLATWDAGDLRSARHTHEVSGIA
eukprot:2992520-Prymnesium_polylepis.1